jgi:hypothetical protein
LSSIGPQTGKICSNISVEIPKSSFLRPKPLEIAFKNTVRKPLASRSTAAINGAEKAPKIPTEWLKNQPNDHISTFFISF